MKHALPAALVAACTSAWAQTPGPAIPDAAAPQSVLITGNPLGSAELATPTSVLSGDALVQRRGSSLGDSLSGLPGVSSSWFGPNANRPVIRGQDGDRIRLLSNAGASLDASGLSADHAVPIDPLVIERIEVLRGPAALLYGGSAVGGVVNAIDNRIPKAAIDGPGGALETRLGGAAAERAVSTLVETGGSGWAWHADAFARRTSDTRVPEFQRPQADGSRQASRRIVNSASQAEGGAVGAAKVWNQGYLGLSLDRYRNDYGSVAEDEVSIRMRRDRLALAGEWRGLSGPFSTLRAQASHTRYQHQEVTGDGVVGTTFNNQGGDVRLEAVHRALPLALGPWAGELEGTLGLQGESSRFSALGDEAFVPGTRSRQAALFALERWRWRDGHLNAGLRAEQVAVDSAGDADGSGARFGAARQRRFAPHSAAVGAVLQLNPTWQASANLSLTERAPTSYELFANGVHAATGTVEIGNPAQTLERGRNLDLALAWRDGAAHARISVFAHRFSNYIVLASSGQPDQVQTDGSRLPVLAFIGVSARLQGLEIEASQPLLTGATRLTLDSRLDLVQGRNLATGDALPRLPPLRATLGLDLAREALTARFELQHAQAQDRVPGGEPSTPGWTMVNLYASQRLTLGGQDALLFLRLANAGNRLAYNAASTATVRALAPLPGRSLSGGLRLSF